MASKSYRAWKAMIGNKPVSEEQKQIIRDELQAETDELMQQCAERKAERLAQRKSKN